MSLNPTSAPTVLDQSCGLPHAIPAGPSPLDGGASATPPVTVPLRETPTSPPPSRRHVHVTVAITPEARLVAVDPAQAPTTRRCRPATRDGRSRLPFAGGAVDAPAATSRPVSTRATPTAPPPSRRHVHGNVAITPRAAARASTPAKATTTMRVHHTDRDADPADLRALEWRRNRYCQPTDADHRT